MSAGSSWTCGFAVAGNDRRFYPADANYQTDNSKGDRNRPEPNRRVLVLSSRFVPEPAHFRYAWARNPMGNVVNERGVPLAAQRSDDWVLEETPVKFATPGGMTEDAARRTVGNQIRKALERQALDEANKIRVAVTGNKATLSGSVHSWAERAVAERAAWSAPGVTSVQDDLNVAPL